MTTLVAWLLVVTLVVLGGFVVLFARLRRGGREARLVGCPPARRRALILVHHRVDGRGAEVVYCSRWVMHPGGACDHACLPRAA
jgi:hypothetical protein